MSQTNKRHTLSIQLKVSMSEEDKTPTIQFVGVGDAHHLGESATEIENYLQSQLLRRSGFPNEVDRRINSIVAPLTKQLNTLIQSVTEVSLETFGSLN